MFSLKLGPKILIPVIILVSVLVTIMVIFATTTFSSYNNQVFEEKLEVTINSLQNRLESMETATRSVSGIAASMPQVVGFVQARDREGLVRFLSPIINDSDVGQCIITDADGMVLARTHSPDQFGDSVLSQINIVEALKGNTAVFYEGGSLTKAAVRGGSPIFDAERRVIGSVSAAIRLDHDLFVDELKALYGTEATLFIGDERNNTTVLLDGKRAVGTKMSDNIKSIVVDRGQDYHGEAEILGKKFLAYYHPLKDSRGNAFATVFLGIPMAEAIKIVHDYTMLSILFSVIGLVIAILILLHIIRSSIIKPVTKLVEATEHVARGAFDVKLDINSKDEIGILSRALTKMIKTVDDMTEDTIQTSMSASAGNLKAKADPSKYEGDYRKLIEYFNKTLDAVITPLNDAMNVMEKIAESKDLTARVQGDYQGDFKTFKEDINHVAATLEDAIAQIDSVVDQVAAATGEISNTAQTLAESTSDQASSLEEISSSLEEINSLTGNNADNAKSGLKLADVAVKAVDAGNIAMEKMNKAMASILQSAQETSNIIKTIDNIAFQTNLLALNAAVEAAHAGEAGKGFAVVAEEVKNLALRSADAARNTNELIEESRKNSEMGSKIVEDVTQSFTEMKDQFNKVKSIVNEISASSDEQAHGVSQISTGVQDMNRTTQQNAANAEESAAAAEQLNAQAAELRSLVNSFTISRKSHSPAFRKPISSAPKAPKQLPHKKPAAPPANLNKMLPLDDDFSDF